MVSAERSHLRVTMRYREHARVKGPLMLLTNDRGVPSRPAGARCEQGTATARPSKRVPYSVQQTGGDDCCDRDKNGCDQVMQHAVGHVTLLGWLWIWKGQLRCSWYQSQQTLRHSSRCKLLVRRMAPEGKALTSATTPGPSLRLGALFPQAGCV